MCHQVHSQEAGFTLIELMVSMSMGLIILAGIAGMFMTNANVSRTMTARTDQMGDLYLVTQLMQAGLRESLATQLAVPITKKVRANLTARGVSLPANYPATDAAFIVLPHWDATSKTLTYQDMEGNVGIFHYQHTATDRIYWLRPIANISTFAEMARDMNTTTGMAVTTVPGTVTGVDVTLTSAYLDENRQSRNLSLSFKTWPRN
ncbi:MAG: prepilin-type N-terminal cleavage/methylation domain-containing protein [Mariprofundus sp.]|nr:prepilin-type N-terminal cleavage/methylation domain-containing protein [Mariprofundus sp.]